MGDAQKKLTNDDLAIRRVQDELIELTDKVLKLDDFCRESNGYSLLSGIQQALLRTQLRIMKSYAEVLLARLEHWD